MKAPWRSEDREESWSVSGGRRARGAARRAAARWAPRRARPRAAARATRTRAGSRRAPCTRWARTRAAAGCAAACRARAPPPPCPTPCGATPLGGRPAGMQHVTHQITLLKHASILLVSAKSKQLKKPEHDIMSFVPGIVRIAQLHRFLVQPWTALPASPCTSPPTHDPSVFYVAVQPAIQKPRIDIIISYATSVDKILEIQ